MIVWDGWQEEVLSEEGNFVACCGRQVGKSEVVSFKAARFILDHPKKRVLIISVTEDQAELMLNRILGWLFELDKKAVAKGSKKPTKHRIELLNGSWVVTKAAGATAAGVRGLTVDVVIIDEAAFCPDVIFAVLSPMLLTTGGVMWLLSTPNAKEGYFWDAYSRSEMGFRTFHVSSEEVAEARPEPLRSVMLAHLERERVRMTKLEYAQNYLGLFLEELAQLFPDDLIRSRQILQRPVVRSPGGRFFLGCDVARFGGDEITYSVLERVGKRYLQREQLVYTHKALTDTIMRIQDLHKAYGFKGVYIDGAGLGAGIVDYFLSTPSPLTHRVVSIENATRSTSPDSTRTRRILKEDLYLNLLRMMEAGEIDLLDDPAIFTSLKSIVVERDVESQKVFIRGAYSHIAESLIRAAWSNHSERLELWAR